MAGDAVEVRSAGIEAGRLRPEVVTVMGELGLDISRHWSKSVEELAGERFDIVVTTCEEAKEACPYFPGAAVTLHWDLPDPAAAVGDEDARLAAFREVRDELWSHIADLVRMIERSYYAQARSALRK
jgi:arsenate reductase